MENKFRAGLLSKPLHLLLGTSVVCTILAMRNPAEGVTEAHWFGIALGLVMLAHWPLKHRGFIFLALMSWLGWYLAAWLGAALQAEVLFQLQKAMNAAVWPQRYISDVITGKAWMLSGLPLLLGLNLDYHSGDRSFRSARRGFWMGLATGPMLAGMVQAWVWVPLAAGIIPAWLLQATAMQGRDSRRSGAGLYLALVFPMALLMYLLPGSSWAPAALAGLVAGACLWPGKASRRWAAALGTALGWAVVSFTMGEAPMEARIASYALVLIIVGAPCYDQNWVTWVVALGAVAVTAFLAGPLAGKLSQPLTREAAAMPALLALLTWMDPGSRTWSMPEE